MNPVKNVTLRSLVFAVTFLATAGLWAQTDTVRVADYHLTTFPETVTTVRVEAIKNVLEQIKPDVLIVQGFTSENARELFFTSILPSVGENFRSVQLPQSDTNHGLFYNGQKVRDVRNDILATSGKNIIEYHVEIDSIPLVVFSLDLFPGSSMESMGVRDEQAQILRDRLNALPENADFIVAGNLNMEDAAETGFATMNDSPVNPLFDPVGQLGKWHDSGIFKEFHTESTRLNPPDEQDPGGLDDRFDMILVSQTLLASGGLTYLADSYVTYGNDGNHLNAAVNFGINTAVGDTLANDLALASIHLPVFADFLVQQPVSSVASRPLRQGEQDVQLFQNFPNPFNAETRISYFLSKASAVELVLFDIMGRPAVTLVKGLQQPGMHQVRLAAESLASGVYYIRLTVGAKNQTRKLILLK